MTTSIFASVISRIYEATNTSTKKELSEIMEISHSTVCRMFNNENVPHAQLYNLWEKTGVSPRWLLTGSGCKFLVHSDYKETTSLDMLASQIRKQERVRAEATVAAARRDMSSLLELLQEKIPTRC